MESLGSLQPALYYDVMDSLTLWTAVDSASSLPVGPVVVSCIPYRAAAGRISCTQELWPKYNRARIALSCGMEEAHEVSLLFFSTPVASDSPHYPLHCWIGPVYSTLLCITPALVPISVSATVILCHFSYRPPCYDVDRGTSSCI